MNDLQRVNNYLRCAVPDCQGEGWLECSECHQFHCSKHDFEECHGCPVRCQFKNCFGFNQRSCARCLSLFCDEHVTPRLHHCAALNRRRSSVTRRATQARRRVHAAKREGGKHAGY